MISTNNRTVSKLGLMLVAGIILFSVFYFTQFEKAHGQTLLTTSMGIGSRGAEVTRLQTFLAGYPNFYPQGLVTGYYGSLTASAVSRFQLANGLPAVGRVGPLTLAKINSIISSGGSGDLSAPIILSFNAVPTAGGATIGWTTDSSASGKVFYSTSPMQTVEAMTNFAEPQIIGSVILTTNASTSQSVSIGNLQANTTYYYRIVSKDAVGNVSVTQQSTFRTN
jgi:peptidoglycan hydrolase-like protein with peptidoglycan-binding domain